MRADLWASGLDCGSHGTCQPDCANASFSCENGQCSDASGTAECVCLPRWDGPGCASCVTGYTLSRGECVWTGGPDDPGFQTVGTWTDANGIVVDTTGAGHSAPGRAAFDGPDRCQGATVSQTFDMPDYERSEPLLVRVSTDADSCTWCDRDTVWLGLNGSWQPVRKLRDYESWTRTELCLGERAYGAQRTLSLSTNVASACASSSEPRGIYVADVDFVADTNGVCPMPGEAVTFWYRTSKDAADATMAVRFANVPATKLPAASSWTKHTYCVPTPHTRVPSRLAFGFSYTKVGQMCDSLQPAAEWWFDDIQVTTDASCTP